MFQQIRYFYKHNSFWKPRRRQTFPINFQPIRKFRLFNFNQTTQCFLESSKNLHKFQETLALDSTIELSYLHIYIIIHKYVRSLYKTRKKLSYNLNSKTQYITSHYGKAVFKNNQAS